MALTPHRWLRVSLIALSLLNLAVAGEPTPPATPATTTSTTRAASAAPLSAFSQDADADPGVTVHIELAMKFVPPDSPRARELIEEASAAIKAGDRPRAAALYAEILPLLRSPEEDRCRAQLLYNWAVDLDYLNQSEDAKQKTLEALALFEQVDGPQSEGVAYANLQMAELIMNGPNDTASRLQAEHYAREALALFEGLRGKGDAITVDVARLLVTIYFAERKYAEVAPVAKRVLDFRDRVLQVEDTTTLLMSVQYGMSLFYLHDYIQADPLLARGYGVWRKFPTYFPREITSVLSARGEIAADEGRNADAEADYREAIELCSRQPGGEKFVLEPSFALAQLFYNEKRYSEAQQLEESVLRIYRAKHGDDLVTAAALEFLGMTLAFQNKLIEAQTTLESALAIRRHLRGDQDLLTAESLHDLAALALSQGNLKLSAQRFSQAMQIRRARLGAHAKSAAFSELGLGKAEFVQQDFPAAEHHLSNALRDLQKILRPNHPDVAGAAYFLGLSDGYQGKYAASLSPLRLNWDIRVHTCGPCLDTIAAGDALAVALYRQTTDRAATLEEAATVLQLTREYLDSARATLQMRTLTLHLSAATLNALHRESEAKIYENEYLATCRHPTGAPTAALCQDAMKHLISVKSVLSY